MKPAAEAASVGPVTAAPVSVETLRERLDQQLDVVAISLSTVLAGPIGHGVKLDGLKEDLRNVMVRGRELDDRGVKDLFDPMALGKIGIAVGACEFHSGLARIQTGLNYFASEQAPLREVETVAFSAPLHEIVRAALQDLGDLIGGNSQNLLSSHNRH